MYSIVSEEAGLLPRERLLQKGAEVLSDQELLAIVLRTGTKSESVLSMANRILKGMTSLADLSRLSLNELQKIPGIGRVKSIELKAMVELAKRIEKAELATARIPGAALRSGTTSVSNIGSSGSGRRRPRGALL